MYVESKTLYIIYVYIYSVPHTRPNRPGWLCVYDACALLYIIMYNTILYSAGPYIIIYYYYYHRHHYCCILCMPNIIIWYTPQRRNNRVGVHTTTRTAREEDSRRRRTPTYSLPAVVNHFWSVCYSNIIPTND